MLNSCSQFNLAAYSEHESHLRSFQGFGSLQHFEGCHKYAQDLEICELDRQLLIALQWPIFFVMIEKMMVSLDS